MNARPCAEDPELFFAEEKTKAGRADVALAKAICAACPELAKCLDGAMTNEKGQGAASRWGIYGGKTPAERAEADPYRSQAKPIVHGTQGGYETHRRRRIPACQPCKDAENQANKERKARRLERAA